MNKEEYTAKVNELKEKFKKEEKTLAKEYAFSNSPVKVGDIIKDHANTIRVTEIKFAMSGTFTAEFPQCVYYGDNLNKSGQISKRNPIGTIWQSNLKTINEKPYKHD